MILAITGGTGSLGKAIISKQETLKQNGITKIRVISRDEIKQDELEKSYQGQIELQCVLADVRSKDRLELALKDVDYVIHAAALKIVPKIEYDVPESIQTNVIGTENVLKTILKTNCKKALFVSTDKAVDPINAYGFSKALAERTWLWAMMIQNKTKFSVCRYGNVFGSRGSIIHKWSDCAKKLQPLPITSTDMSRFFIKVQDAAQFVIEELFDIGAGEIAIPMMKAAPMKKLAEAIWRYHHGDEKGSVPLNEIGIREGEKIHEVLTSINDSKIYELKKEEESQGKFFIRPLTDKVACYQYIKRTPKLIYSPLSSNNSLQLSDDDLSIFYHDWLKCF